MPEYNPAQIFLNVNAPDAEQKIPALQSSMGSGTGKCCNHRILKGVRIRVERALSELVIVILRVEDRLPVECLRRVTETSQRAI